MTLPCSYFQTVIALLLQPGKQKMNPERLSGYDSQRERSLQPFPFTATADQAHVVAATMSLMNLPIISLS